VDPARSAGRNPAKEPRLKKGLSTLFILIFIVVPAWSLFTGTDQYDLDNLNSESQLDQEYFLDLLAYRGFWTPQAGETLPSVFIRTTEGSLNTTRLYIEREAGFRSLFSSGTFLGYQLRQRDDLEESFLTQYFEGEARLAKNFSLRVTGQPTGKKQGSDLGLGAELRVGDGWVALENTWVDFNFNSKNEDNETDRRRLYDTVVRAGWAQGAGAFDLRWEWESPVERVRPEEGHVFFHRAQRGQLRWRAGNWKGDVALDLHRRALEDLGGIKQQLFKKEAIRGGIQWKKQLVKHQLDLGLETHRRRSYFDGKDTTDEFNRDLLEIQPYGQFTWRNSNRLSFPVGLYGAWAEENRREASGTNVERQYTEWKLALPLRLDWSPQISFVLLTTWDLNPTASTAIFDGGNAMLQARW
jgi:hypothetical protein